MANDAVHEQLSLMVHRPRLVWPGLDRMDLHRRQIAGDGNCLFASLSDQLYGIPGRHLEVRATVIDHMRAYRPLFEGWATKDDLQLKRATRAATNAIRNTISDDAFEEYLVIMAKPGTYGGEPELMAFVQAYDQDVLVHLPRRPGYPESLPYTNTHRGLEATAKPHLNICYGGDDSANAHYDSARKNNPTVIPILSKPVHSQPDASLSSSPTRLMPVVTARAIRSSRSEFSRDIMQELALNNPGRARSSSISSSHRSSSSKRSFDDDGESQRASKKADRRRSTRARALLDPASTVDTPAKHKTKLSTNSGLATPASTQESDTSTDQSDPGSDADMPVHQRPTPVHSRSLTPEVRNISLNPTRRGSGLGERASSNEQVGQSRVTEHRRSSLRA